MANQQSSSFDFPPIDAPWSSSGFVTIDSSFLPTQQETLKDDDFGLEAFIPWDSIDQEQSGLMRIPANEQQIYTQSASMSDVEEQPELEDDDDDEEEDDDNIYEVNEYDGADDVSMDQVMDELVLVPQHSAGLDSLGSSTQKLESYDFFSDYLINGNDADLPPPQSQTHLQFMDSAPSQQTISYSSQESSSATDFSLFDTNVPADSNTTISQPPNIEFNTLAAYVGDSLFANMEDNTPEQYTLALKGLQHVYNNVLGDSTKTMQVQAIEPKALLNESESQVPSPSSQRSNSSVSLDLFPAVSPPQIPLSSASTSPSDYSVDSASDKEVVAAPEKLERKKAQVIAATGTHQCKLINPATKEPCNKKFSRPYDLIRHQDTIHAAVRKTYKCSSCGSSSRTFSRMDALTRHIRVKHS